MLNEHRAFTGRDGAGAVVGWLDERQMVTKLFPCPQNHRSREERLIPWLSHRRWFGSCEGNFTVNRKHLHPLESPMDENQDPTLSGCRWLGGNPGMGTGTHRWHPDAPVPWCGPRVFLGHC